MPPKSPRPQKENELRKLARIAVLKLNYHSLREYELAMYRKAIEEADKRDKSTARCAA